MPTTAPKTPPGGPKGSDKGKGQNASRNITLSGDGSISTGITGDQSLELTFSDLATPFNTRHITGFCTSHDTMSAKFAVVGGDFSELVVDTVNNDALYRDEAGHFFILPENDPSKTPILITEYGRDYADGLFWQDESGDAEYIPAALHKTASGYRMAISDVWYGYDWETGEDNKRFDEWVILDMSSSGVIDPESIRWNAAIAGYEEQFNEDIDEDAVIGVNVSALMELRSDEPSEFQQVGDKLYMDSGNSIYIIPEDGSPSKYSAALSSQSWEHNLGNVMVLSPLPTISKGERPTRQTGRPQLTLNE